MCNVTHVLHKCNTDVTFVKHNCIYEYIFPEQLITYD